jgi:hypothetical protein
MVSTIGHLPGYASSSLEPTLSTTTIITSLTGRKARHHTPTRFQHTQPIDPTAQTTTAAPTPNSAGKIPGKFGQVRKGEPDAPTTSNRLEPHRHHHLINQYNPCRGSSIGRACGSYNSKEINLKVVGSSPTFGYSYHIKLIRAAVLLLFWWDTHWGRLYVFGE